MKKTPFKEVLVRLHWVSTSQFGIDPLKALRSLRGIPAYLKDLREFQRAYKGELTLMPCLHDRYEEGGSTKSEYFWQDLLVARWIFEAKPDRHVDIGSRVDGFVAHVASFREVEVFDVRPISTHVPGVAFRQADLMRMDKPPELAGGYCDSLSCLHALEHFGLGRYGDPLDSAGYEHGIANMATLLQPGGTFYLSTPIGRERVEFNANWVFHPQRIVELAKQHFLDLSRLTIVKPSGIVKEVSLTMDSLEELAGETYNLGIFVFVKLQSGSVE